jgi:hypothetical protein
MEQMQTRTVSPIYVCSEGNGFQEGKRRGAERVPKLLRASTVPPREAVPPFLLSQGDPEGGIGPALRRAECFVVLAAQQRTLVHDELIFGIHQAALGALRYFRAFGGAARAYSGAISLEAEQVGYVPGGDEHGPCDQYQA